MSSLGVNCRNGIIAPGLKISASDLIELSNAHKNGIVTQITARPAIVIAMAFDAHFELLHSTFSTPAFFPKNKISHAKTLRKNKTENSQNASDDSVHYAAGKP
jgi:hypothetical protein